MYVEERDAFLLLLFEELAFWYPSVEENQKKVHPVQATHKAGQPAHAEVPVFCHLGFCDRVCQLQLGERDRGNWTCCCLHAALRMVPLCGDTLVILLDPFENHCSTRLGGNWIQEGSPSPILMQILDTSQCICRFLYTASALVCWDTEGIPCAGKGVWEGLQAHTEDKLLTPTPSHSLGGMGNETKQRQGHFRQGYPGNFVLHRWVWAGGKEERQVKKIFLLRLTGTLASPRACSLVKLWSSQKTGGGVGSYFKPLWV